MIDTFRYLHGEKRKFTRIGIDIIEFEGEMVEKHIYTRIDHILISNNLENELQTAKIYETQKIISDHRLMTIDIMMSPKVKIEKPNRNKNKRIDIEKLKTAEVANKFTDKVKQNLK